MTLLTIVQQHCRVHGLYVPTSVVSNTDATTAQLFGLLNELCDEMIDEAGFQSVKVEKLWTFIAAEDQGSLVDITGDDGFRYVHPNTLFDRTLRRPVYGPLGDEDWQRIKALPNPGPWYKYRILGDHLLINPVPTASTLSQIAFEYASSNFIRSSGGTLQSKFLADTDVPVLPESLFRKGLAYRWKQTKGLNYSADERRYYDMLNNFISRDATKPVVNTGKDLMPGVRPGIFVPSGNWPL